MVEFPRFGGGQPELSCFHCKFVYESSNFGAGAQGDRFDRICTEAEIGGFLKEFVLETSQFRAPPPESRKFDQNGPPGTGAEIG